ncbi:MAG: hypothetical protein KC486_17800, partial [Myxococcales bacterium]|nr:hypothetical protein [Myxococcales bacterium]
EDPLELPNDLRIAARIDLESADLEAALGHLERWAATPSVDVGDSDSESDGDEGGTDGPTGAAADEPRAGQGGLPPPPLVAGLALSQVGFQVKHIRELLGGLGFAPPELLLLQDPEGAVVWMWRLPCDLADLQALVEGGWELRLRTLVRGAIAEPREPARFPFDLLLLPGDRLALVPAGQGLRLLRWLSGGAPRPSLGPEASGEPPSDALASLEAAAIRLVVELRVGGVFSLGSAGAQGERLLVRATADGLAFSGSLPPAP